ncbi:ATP-binding protein [Paenirhodobacter sp.]|uniref:ATP-binding protein n=1 Tax=Paenirhodobacter sp. TaxID=1965326 RepID=UPI003B4007A8
MLPTLPSASSRSAWPEWRALDEQRRAGPTFKDRLGLLVDREAAERDAKRLTARLKSAALRQAASVEDLDLRTPRGIDRAVMAHLNDGGWIDRLIHNAHRPRLSGESMRRRAAKPLDLNPQT